VRIIKTGRMTLYFLLGSRKLTTKMTRMKKFILSSGAVILGASVSCCYSYFNGSPWFFERIAMPVARAMDPEKAHHMSVYLASKGFIPKINDKDPEILVRRT